MKTAKPIVLFLILAPVIFTSYKRGGDKMFKGKYPLDIYQTTLLVQYLDTAKKQKWVSNYQKVQVKQWKKYKFGYEMIDMKQFEGGLKKSQYGDLDKYRYILKVHLGHRTTYNTATKGYTHFPHYYFNFYDRKQNKEYELIDPGGDFGATIVGHLNKVFKDKISATAK